MFAEGVYRNFFFFFSCTGLIPEEADGEEKIKYDWEKQMLIKFTEIVI